MTNDTSITRLLTRKSQERNGDLVDLRHGEMSMLRMLTLLDFVIVKCLYEVC